MRIRNRIQHVFRLLMRRVRAFLAAFHPVRLKKRAKHTVRLKMRQLRAIVNSFRPEHFERPHKCCRKEENMGPVEKFGPDTTLQRCTVCGCRHFEQIVDPGEFGITMGG